MKLIKFFISLSIFLNICTASSLWNEKSNSPFVKKASYAVGDAITIIIDENLNAVQAGSTNTNRVTSTGLDFDSQSDQSTMIDRRTNKYRADNGASLDLGGRNRYTGTGKTSRETSIKTKITATVIDVQPNGALFVLGQKQIKVNDELEQVEVSGLVNADDIADDNTVYSTQIANAKINIKGTGTVSNPQRPSMMSRMFEWLF